MWKITKMKLTKCTISWWPCAAAKCRGVSSPRLVEFMRAPLCTSISTIFRWPSLAAQCSGLNPWSSLKCTSKHHWTSVESWISWNHESLQYSYPWFMSCSVSSSQTRTCIATPSRHHWNMSSIFVKKTMSTRRT